MEKIGARFDRVVMRIADGLLEKSTAPD
jgi:hypothetical protein